MLGLRSGTLRRRMSASARPETTTARAKTISIVGKVRPASLTSRLMTEKKSAERAMYRMPAEKRGAGVDWRVGGMGSFESGRRAAAHHSPTSYAVLSGRDWTG